MTMSVNDNGVVKQVQTLHVNDNGVVKAVKEGWVNDNGTVKQFYASAGPPGAPTNLRSTAATSSSVSLAWDAAPPNGFAVTAYRVEWGTDGVNFPSGANLGNVLTYTASGLNASTTYYFRVRATNSAGNGPWSTVLSQQTAAGPPLTPTAFINASSTTASTVTMRITRNASGPLPTSYVIDQRENKGSNSGGWTQVANPAYTTSPQDVVISGLTSSTAYEFRVKARNASGDSAYATDMFMVTSRSGTGSSSNLTIGTDPEDTGQFKDLGRGLNSASEGGGGQAFGSGGPVNINGKTVERIARSGNTAFTVTLQGSPTQTQFSRITIYPGGANGSSSARTFRTADAVWTPGIGLTGTMGNWNWPTSDVASWADGATWTIEITN